MLSLEDCHQLCIQLYHILQQVKEDEKDEKAMPLPIKTPSGDIVYQRDGQDQMMLKTSAQELVGLQLPVE